MPVPSAGWERAKKPKHSARGPPRPSPSRPRGAPALLAERPAGGRGGAFTGTRMAATGIRPQSAGVIFVRTALLDHDAPARVHDEDRNRAMQKPGAVNRGFARRAGGAVAFVDQDQLLLGRVARHELFA